MHFHDHSFFLPSCLEKHLEGLQTHSRDMQALELGVPGCDKDVIGSASWTTVRAAFSKSNIILGSQTRKPEPRAEQLANGPYSRS